MYTGSPRCQHSYYYKTGLILSTNAGQHHVEFVWNLQFQSQTAVCFQEWCLVVHASLESCAGNFCAALMWTSVSISLGSPIISISLLLLSVVLSLLSLFVSFLFNRFFFQQSFFLTFCSFLKPYISSNWRSFW